MSTKHCTRCGYACPDEALYCSQCGTALHLAGEDPLIGQTIAGRYYLIERIGQGGAGTLYRAEHVTLRRRMAVKLLHHQLSVNEEAVERFRREAITVCEIDNDHILQVHDFGRADDGRLFFAMEYLEGEPLSALLLREGPMPVDRVVDIMGQLADALMEAHALGYVHRDLRPRNVFLTRRRGRSDFVKLLDFGLAKLVLPDVDAAKTNMGMTFGDPHYMAPEQARGEVVDRRADLYSLGAISFETLTGEPPYKGAGTFDILTKVLDAQVPRIRDRRPDCPEWLEAVVRVALAKSPVDRFATVAQLLTALERKQVLERQPPFGLQVVVPPRERMTAIDMMTPMKAQTIPPPQPEPPAPQPAAVPAQAPSGPSGAVGPSGPPPRGATRAYEAVKLDAPQDSSPKLTRRERKQLEQERRAQERLSSPGHPEAADRRAREIAARELAERAAREAAEQEAKLKAEQEARLRAEEEARLRVQQEARERAEKEARLKAEREARRRAEEEARLKAEQEARERAEQEAREEAEREAWEQAEREARERAERETREKAEREAREKAERETREREKAERAAREKAERAAREKAEQEAREREQAEREIERKSRKAADRAKEVASRIMHQSATARAQEPPRQEAVASEAAAWEEAALQLMNTAGAETLHAPTAPPAVSAQDLRTEVGIADMPTLPVMPVPQGHVRHDEIADEDATRPTPMALPIDEDAAAVTTMPLPAYSAGDVTQVELPRLQQEPARQDDRGGAETMPVKQITGEHKQLTGEHERTWFDTELGTGTATSQHPAYPADEYEPQRSRPMNVVIAVAVATLLLVAIGTVLILAKTRSSGGEAETAKSVPGPAEAPKAVQPAVPAPAPKAEVPAPAPQPVPTVQAVKEPPPAKETQPAAPVAQPLPAAPHPPAPQAVKTPPVQAVKAPPPAIQPAKASPPAPAVARAPHPPVKEPVKEREPPPKKAPSPVASKEPPKGLGAGKKPEVAAPAEQAEPAKNNEGAELLIQQGRQRLQGGDVSSAAASFAKARELSPRSAEAVAGLGEVAFEQGNWDEAVKQLRQAIKLAPRHTSYQVLLGQSLYKLGRYRDAAEACRRALKQDPGLLEAQQTLELAEKKLGEAGEAP